MFGVRKWPEKAIRGSFIYCEMSNRIAEKVKQISKKYHNGSWSMHFSASSFLVDGSICFTLSSGMDMENGI